MIQNLRVLTCFLILILIGENKGWTQEEGVEKKKLTSVALYGQCIDSAKWYQQHDNHYEALKNGFRALRLYQKYRWAEVQPTPVHNVLSVSLEKIGAYSDAIYHQRKVLDLIQPDNERYKMQYYQFDRVGSLYFRLKNLDSAQYFFEKGLRYAETKKDAELVGHAYNNLGLVSFQKKRNNEAIEYFEKGLKYYRACKPKSDRSLFMETLIKGNIAECLQNDNPMKSAYLKEDIEGSLRYGDFSNATKAGVLLARYHLDKGEIAKAKKQFVQAKEWLQESGVNKQTRLEFWHLGAQIYSRSGEVEASIACQKKLMKLVDEIAGPDVVNEQHQIYSNYELDRIENDLELEKVYSLKKESEIEALNHQSELAKYRFLAIIGMGSLILILAVVFILKLRGDVRKKAREKSLMDKIHRIEQEFKTERLQRSALSLQRKKEFSERLMNQIQGMDNLLTEDRNAIRMTLLNELEIDKAVIEEEKNVEQVGEDFLIQLKMTYPQLTDGDIKLLSLIKMKLTNKQIAEIRNINASSVKMARNRLRKKMNIPKGQDFGDFLSF